MLKQVFLGQARQRGGGLNSVLVRWERRACTSKIQASDGPFYSCQ